MTSSKSLHLGFWTSIQTVLKLIQVPVDTKLHGGSTQFIWIPPVSTERNLEIQIPSKQLHSAITRQAGERRSPFPPSLFSLLKPGSEMRVHLAIILILCTANTFLNYKHQGKVNTLF